MEKHNKITPPMGSTQSLEEAADTKAANSRYIIEKMKGLDDTNLRIFKVKAALDRGVEYNGSMPVLLEAYATFGIVPYVLEGAA